MTILRHFLHGHLYAPLALSLCVSVWGAVGLTTDRHPADLKVVSITDTPPGGVAIVKVVGIEEKDCEGVTHRWLFDKNGVYHDLPDVGVFQPTPGIVTTFDHEFKVPVTMPVGPAIYNSVVMRWCNIWQHAFRPVIDHYNSQFNVTK